MSNLKNLSIKDATFFIYEDPNMSTHLAKGGLMIGISLKESKQEQVWIVNKLLIGQKFDPSTIEGNKMAYDEIKNMKASGKINLVDDCNTLSCYENGREKLILHKKLSWNNV